MVKNDDITCLGILREGITASADLNACGADSSGMEELDGRLLAGLARDEFLHCHQTVMREGIFTASRKGGCNLDGVFIGFDGLHVFG